MSQTKEMAKTYRTPDASRGADERDQPEAGHGRVTDTPAGRESDPEPRSTTTAYPQTVFEEAHERRRWRRPSRAGATPRPNRARADYGGGGGGSRIEGR